MSEKEELEKKIAELTALKNELKNEEQAVKLTMNSMYGAIANSYFVCFNPEVAEAITLQGQDLIQSAEKFINKYFYEFWHKDEELHKKLGIDTPKRISKPMVVYIDTDSVSGDTSIKLDDGRNIEIQDLYKEGMESAGSTLAGHESVSIKNKVLNWSDEKGLYYADVKRVIKHRVSKPKWKLKTKSGKEIIVTNDHSMIVFRDGEKMEIKPSEILKTDKILTVKNAG